MMNRSNIIRIHKLYDKVSGDLNYTESDISLLKELISSIDDEILEDTSATGGASVGGAVSTGMAMANATTAGMGSVHSSQPSSLPGSLNGLSWASGGGETGSGDVSIPYNPSGANRMFQKMPMGKNHGAKTGKKSREKKLNLKTLKDLMKSKKPSGKVMNFNTFIKKDITTKVTKVKD